MSLAILIPARNEAPRIGHVLEDARRVLPQAHLVVVDGGSMDGTREVARDLGATVVHCPHGGYARILSHGYRACLDLGARVVVQLDADGQHPPSSAPALLEPVAHANIVIGSREGTRTPGSWPRRAGNRVLAGAVRFATGLDLRDVTSGFWALDHQALSLFARHFPRDVADANIRVMAARCGLVIREVPVRMEERVGGRSMHEGLLGLGHFGLSLGAIAREALLSPNLLP